MDMCKGEDNADGRIFATIKNDCYCKVGRAYMEGSLFQPKHLSSRLRKISSSALPPEHPNAPHSTYSMHISMHGAYLFVCFPSENITYPPHASVRHEHGPPRNTHPAQFPNNMTKRTLGIDGDKTSDVVRREALDGVVNRQVLVDGVVDLDVARLLPRVPGRQRFLDGSGEGSACAAYAGDAARWQCRCSGHRDGGDTTGRRGGAGRSGQGAAEDGGGSATGEHG